MIVYDCSTHIWISRLPRIYQFNHFPRNVFFSLNVHLQMTFQQTKIGIFRRAVAMYYHLDQSGYCVKTFCAGHQVF